MRFPSPIAVLLIFSSVVSAWGSGTGTMYIVGGSVSGTGTISGTVSVGAAGSVTPGATVGTLPIDGAMNVSAMADGGSGKLVFGLNARNGSNDKITTTGNLTIGTGKLGFSDFTFTNLGGLEVGTYTLITSGGITGSLDSGNLAGTIGNYTATVAISGNNIVLNISQTYAQWDASDVADLSNTAGNPDADSLTNLQEFAFGTDPTVASAAVMSYVANGAVTPGLPKPVNLASPGVDYRAIFTRRKDYLAAGLTYTVQFSADLSNWVNSGATPTLLSDPNSSGPVDAVSVPYPLFIPTANGVEKPPFFRVEVTSP